MLLDEGLDGAKGGTALADRVLAVLKARKGQKLEPQYLYSLDLPLPSGGRTSITAPIPADLAASFAQFPTQA